MAENKPVQSPERLALIKKAEELERQGIFDKDVNDDPPSKVILPGTVDYTQKKLKTRIAARFAFNKARQFLNKNLIKTGALKVKAILGAEKFDALNSGAVITCNHFSPLDSFMTQLAYEAAKETKKKRKFFRVIREGNYTSFPGFYGYLMRNCNTLPLSSNPETMREFMEAVDEILKRGDLVLVYPEQSLWPNYRKPKPLKRGAFSFAAKARVPILPIFITMEDGENYDSEGFKEQIYTIHIFDPIYPEEGKNPAQNAALMMQKNYELWKGCYEKTYGIPLTYLCDENKKDVE